MIWALLCALWALQSVLAATHHAPRQAFLTMVIAIFFAFIGRIVYTRDPRK
jgi:hypothetical protein